MRTAPAPAGRTDMRTVHIHHLLRQLAEIRTRSDLTQRDLARRIGVARNTLVRWEIGILTPTVLRLLSWFLHLGITVALVDQDGHIHHTRATDTLDADAAAQAIYARIAAILVAERRRLDITQAQIAESASVGKLRDWEHLRQRPSLESLFCWCRELGCKLVIVMPADHPAAPKGQPPALADLSLAA